MSLVEHAKTEMKHWIESDDEMSILMSKQILEIVELFASHGHSGCSAGMAIPVITKLLDFKPLKPLTGKADEWNEVGEGVFQNRRCSNIFKDGKTGVAYNIEGNVFRNQNGSTFTGDKSCTVVKFPYRPKEPNIVNIYERPEKKETVQPAKGEDNVKTDGNSENCCPDGKEGNTPDSGGCQEAPPAA